MHFTDEARQVGAGVTNAGAGIHKRALESVVNPVMTAVNSCCRLRRNFGFAILSAEDQLEDTLHPEEIRLLPPRACRIKRVEFSLGRVAVRLALKQIGFDNPVPILRGEKGEPLWPDGITGSISHCYPWSIAVVAKSPNHFAIGIDLESTARFQGPDISDLVCRDVERDWARAGCDFQERVAMIFSAKEAVYKAFYPLCHRYIDFKEVELSWSPEDYRFHCRCITALSPSIPLGTACDIYCRCHGGLVFSHSTAYVEEIFSC